jgi:hypothetical protein
MFFSLGCKPSILQNDVPAVDTEKSKQTTPTFTAITNPEKKEHNSISYYVPSDWSEIEYQGSWIYLAPGSELIDPSSEKVSVTVTNLPPEDKVSLANIIDADLKEIGKILPGINITLDPVPARLGPIDGLEFRFEATIMGKTVDFKRVYATREGKMYRMVHSGEKDMKYDDIFAEIVTSVEPR